MGWRQYEVQTIGLVSVTDDNGGAVEATYEMGIVVTGKARVFAGHFVGVALNNGKRFSAEDERSIIAALKQLASDLAAVGLDLRCMGLDPHWTQSGLSWNTGWGYCEGYAGAVHMMDAAPINAAGFDLDRFIAEAVSGMRIGMQDR